MFYVEQFREVALNGYVDNQNLKPWKNNHFKKVLYFFFFMNS